MKRLALLVAMPVLALVPALAACAPTAPSGAKPLSDTPRRCAFVDQVSGYTVNKDTVFVRAGSTVYQIEVTGVCLDLDAGIALGFKTNLGSSEMCVGDWITIVTPSSGIGPGQCQAQVVKALTSDQVAALPKASRP